MGRWEPDARGRLEQAALDLYQERGFEQTTVTEIAERAGLAERTFFRHSVDKRGVLFGEQDLLRTICVRTIEAAPASTLPLDAVATALEALVPVFQERHELVRQRQAVIAANPGLQERELLKEAWLTSAMAEALQRRGVTNPAASLAAIGFLLGFNQQHPEKASTALTELMQYLAEGKLELIVGQTFPLAEAAEAHRVIEARKTSGKVVLLVEAGRKMVAVEGTVIS